MKIRRCVLRTYCLISSILFLFFSISQAHAQRQSALTDSAAIFDKIDQGGDQSTLAISLFQKNLDEQIHLARHQVDLAEQNFDKGNYVKGVSQLAFLFELKGYYDSARYFAEKALNLLGEQCAHSTIEQNGLLLRCYARAGDHEKAAQTLAKFELCAEADNPSKLHVLKEKSWYYLIRHQYQPLADAFLEWEDIMIRKNALTSDKMSHLLLASMLLELAEFEPASAHIESFVSAVDRETEPYLFATSKMLSAQIAAEQKRFSVSLSLYQEAYDLFVSLGAKGKQISCLVAMGGNCIKVNDFIAAGSHLYAAGVLIQQSEGQLNYLRSSLFIENARMHLELGKLNDAISYAQQALTSASAHSNKLEEVGIREFLADVSEQSGELEMAFEFRKSIEQILKELKFYTAYDYFLQLAVSYDKSRKDFLRAQQETNELIKVQGAQISHLTKYILAGSVLFLLIIVGLMLVRVVLKQKANRLLKKKNELIVTQNKELMLTNDALNEARIKAETASVAKSNFLAITSHEIRTPLNGIMGMASLLSDSELDQNQKNYVENIIKSSENLLIILNDILDFSKLEAGKINLETKLIDLERLLDEVKTIFAKQAQDRNITITRKIGNAGIKFFRGDILRIRQVLINLVSNAVKFTENGTVKIIVDLEELSKDNEDENNRSAVLRFSVQDDGIGISPEKQQLIFESFEQEDSSTSRKFGGIGLGLTISKKLVELMGGEMGLQSQKNVGTTFYFSLPVFIPDITNKQNEVPVNSKSEEEEEAIKNIPLAERFPMRILLAEDNMFNKLFIEKLFEKFGYEEFAHAENGNQVLEMMEKEKFDIILMDIQMPEKDGIQTTKEIIDRYGKKRPFIVAVTADSNDSNKEFYLNSGMDAFLSKPFKEKDLRSILEKYGKRLAS